MSSSLPPQIHSPSDHISPGSLKELNQHVGNSGSSFPSSSVLVMCCTYTYGARDYTQGACGPYLSQVYVLFSLCGILRCVLGCLWMRCMPFSWSRSLPLSPSNTCSTLRIHITCLVPAGTWVAASGRQLQRQSGHICCPGAPHSWLLLAAAAPCPQGRTGSCRFRQDLPCF